MAIEPVCILDIPNIRAEKDCRCFVCEVLIPRGCHCGVDGHGRLLCSSSCLSAVRSWRESDLLQEELNFFDGDDDDEDADAQYLRISKDIQAMNREVGRALFMGPMLGLIPFIFDTEPHQLALLRDQPQPKAIEVDGSWCGE